MVRHSRRVEALARANTYLAQGNNALAREHFIKACDVTPQHAYQLIKVSRSALAVYQLLTAKFVPQELKRQGIPYVVAPYEADSQLCYLEAQGIIDGIITEDSDLLVFGCKKVLYKMDAEGNVTEVCRERFKICKEARFDGWTDLEFRQFV